MYLIKEVEIGGLERNIKVYDGLKTYNINDQFIAINDFWGDTSIIIGEFCDTSKFIKLGNAYFIPYANEYNMKDLYDGYKKMELNVSEMSNDVKGHIVIVKQAENIKTDGETLFRRYPTEIIVLLKEGQYLNLYDKKLKVIENKLCFVL